MTIEVQGVLNSQKQIEILDKQKLVPIKEAHKPGELLRIVFSDEWEGEHAMASRRFHAMRDEYADAVGLDKEYAKALLKYRHGVTLPFMAGFKPPVGQRGSFLEVEVAGEQRLFWMKSVTVYTMNEWTVLMLGTEKDMAGV